MTIKVRILHYVAKVLGVLIHIDGLPYGSSRNVAKRMDDEQPAECGHWHL